MLGELDQHMDDERLHVVAAPGSGKTVLGLEVVRRFDAPTLILAPTLAIRDQWIQRLMDLFLPDGIDEPEWISRDLRQPRFFNVVTYQALHMAMVEIENVEDLDLEEIEERMAEDSDEGDAEEEDERPIEEKVTSWMSQKKSKPKNTLLEGLPGKIQAAGITTIVLDEAHHLRTSWWKSLTSLLDALEGTIRLVALTATPPFDAVDYEWERYVELCGPVDAEIPVPELVLEGNLCPHQDLIVFSTPSDAEAAEIQRFRKGVEAFKKWLLSNDEFTSHLITDPWIVDPLNHVEDILSEPEYFSSMLIFLKSQGFKPSRDAVGLITDSEKKMPRLDDKWLEILLSRVLYPPNVERPKHPPYLEEIGDELRRIGAIERRRVSLQNVKEIEKLLKQSISKLQSIVNIANQEFSALNNELRMVILTDFIRKAALPKDSSDKTPLNKIGVVPIFEAIRREATGAKLGILTGSFVVIPKNSSSDFLQHASAIGLDRSEVIFKDLDHDDRFCSVSAPSQEKHKLTKAVTDLFTSGGIEILVGTKALLGEGWDAPSVNSLVMASFVGSYMLSNQMRGRAIRSIPGNPDKTANIWHLVCVQPKKADPGPDYYIMERRFKAFVGVSNLESVIENGLRRLNVGEPPFKEGDLNTINQGMYEQAASREKMRQAWESALRRGDDGVRLVEDIQTKRISLPRGFVFYNTISMLFWEGVFWSTFLMVFWLDGTTGVFSSSEDGIAALWLLAAGLIFCALVGLPFMLKAGYLLIKHGRVQSSIRMIGTAVLRTLCQIGEIRTDFTKLRVVADDDDYGFVYCRLEGGSSREKSVYLRALQEVLDPIENPRYLLMRKTSLKTFMTRKDYHAVPSVIGQRKAHAELFAQMWKNYVGEMELIFTRNREGRMILLKARNHSLSSAFRPKSDRVTKWQ